MIQATLNEWAAELGKEARTLKTLLRKAGITSEPHEKLSPLQVVNALMGDERAEKIRNLKLDGDLKAAELATLEGRLMEPEVVTERINKALGLIRQAVLSGRAEVPPRANPQDHVTAMTAWSQWEERFFPFVREGMSSAGAVEFPTPTLQEATP